MRVKEEMKGRKKKKTVNTYENDLHFLRLYLIMMKALNCLQVDVQNAMLILKKMNADSK